MALLLWQLLLIRLQLLRWQRLLALAPPGAVPRWQLLLRQLQLWLLLRRQLVLL